jgi:uncharacterized Fe-S cluster-containing radical SAM superfamily protein
MATIFYGIPGNAERKIDTWIRATGAPSVFSEKDDWIREHRAELLGKYEVVPINEALARYPDADVWVTYRRANNTARMLSKVVPPEKIHFLEADLEYRRGCGYLGRFISYRKDTFSPCCITGKAPVIKTSGSIPERLSQWQEYVTGLVDDIRCGRPNKCDKCHMLKYGFYRKSVKLDEINFGSNQPGDVCNFKCTYCFCANTLRTITREEGMTTYEILRQLSEMPEYDTEDFIVQLANGEFSANKHCDEMINIFLGTKWRFNIVSNLSIYKEGLATLLKDGRIRKITTSLDSGTPETFKKVKQVDAFAKVVGNLRKYPLDNTVLLMKYIFLEDVNDNEADIDGYYELVKELGGCVMLSSNLGAPFTEKMRELVLQIVQRAKADGIKVTAGSAYLAPKDAEFISEIYAGALIDD